MPKPDRFGVRILMYGLILMRSIKNCLLLILVFLILGVLPTPQPSTVKALDGLWGFCTPDQTTACIKKIEVTSSEDAITTIRSQQEADAMNVEFSVGCSTGPSGSCEGHPTIKSLQTYVDGKCTTDLRLGLNRPWMRISGGVRDHPTWKISIELNTGTFDPAFTIGHGTTRTVRTEQSDGTFAFLWEAIPVLISSGGVPNTVGTPVTNPNYLADLRTALATAVAEYVYYRAFSNVLPATQFLVGNCQLLPLAGAWFEANAGGLAMDWTKFIASNTNIATGVFPIQAYAPHFIKSESLANAKLGLPSYVYSPISTTTIVEPTKIVNSARIQMFLPKVYLVSLGYEKASDFDLSTISVAVEDGPEAKPSFKILDDGILLNLGISHYSMPNPTVTILAKKSNTAVTVPSTLIVVPKPTVTTKKTATAKSIADYANLAVTKTSTVSLKVSTASKKYCSVVSTKVKGLTTMRLKGLRKGTCRATVTVTTKGGPAKRATVTFAIS
jgi:hypothetical protein